MGIQQALFAGSSSNWTLVDTWSNQTQGDNVSMPNTQSGDILLAFLGNRAEAQAPDSSSGWSQIRRREAGDLNYSIFAAVITSANTQFSTSNNFQDYDYAFFCAFRTSSAFTSTSSVLWRGQSDDGYGESPTNNDRVRSFAMNSLALQVVWYERTIGSIWVPPANTTLVGSDGDDGTNNGSVAVSSQEIGTAGNYSWGAWGDTDAGSSDYWLTGYVEVQQP